MTSSNRIVFPANSARADFPGEEGNLRSENTKNCQKQGKGQQRFLPGLKRPVLSNCGLVMNLHDQHCLKHDYLCLYILLVGFICVKNIWWLFQRLLWKPFVIRPHRGSILGGEGNLFNSWHSFEFSVTLSNFIKGQTLSIFPENLFLLPPDSFGNFLNICKNKTHFLQPPAAETFSSQSSRDFPDNQQLVRA